MDGSNKVGYAKCFVPAMGGRSDGVESSCDISDAGKNAGSASSSHKELSGRAADEFIDKHFPNADIPVRSKVPSIIRTELKKKVTPSVLFRRWADVPTALNLPATLLKTEKNQLLRV